ncbi:hypothetical protein SNE40_009913 [Patella caerulea]|uniref:Uncharacterized protein n=1 Tax=Patella caerulea TaxID=87958 RepID=A0AAN8PQX6_PATCE
MTGLTFASLKQHNSLIPLFFFTGIGFAGAMGYLFRLASRCPDVSWNKTSNPLPWQQWKPTDQYKFYSPSRDYSKERFPAERPQID